MTQTKDTPDTQALDDILAEVDGGVITQEEAADRLGLVPSGPLGVNPAVLIDLKSSTPREEIKQRPTFRKGPNGQRVRGPDLSYVDARYVMDRLDEVVGPENWSVDHTVLGDGSVVARITIRVTDGEVTHYVTKADVGVASTIEPMKGAFSDAFKRAAVHWGVARDLYEEREEESAAPSATRQRPIRERYPDDDEDMQDEQPASARPAQRRTGNNGYRSSGGGRTDNRPIDTRLREKREAYDAFMETFDPEDSPWYCPDHGKVKVLEPGIGKTSGQPYGGKLVCTEYMCREGGPWVEDILRSQR